MPSDARFLDSKVAVSGSRVEISSGSGGSVIISRNGPQSSMLFKPTM